ncbi:MAG: NFACT family protein [Clostridia bacterium]|nr:NFACT family protein [Clostridia bacterium]
MLDGIFCRALGDELNKLSGAKIEKIHHISNKELVFELFGGERNTLLISALPSAPRICFIKEYDRPQNPTMLCMLFRKHLSGGRITSVSALQDERIIKFSFVAADELGHIEEKYLYVELMGKYSNCILCSHDDRILGAFSVSDITDKRCIMSGARYEPPEKQNKFPPFSVTKEQFLLLAAQNSHRTADDFLLQSFLGFSPVTAREVSFKATGETDSLLLSADHNKLWNEFEKLLDSVRTQSVTPCIAANGKAFSYTTLCQYGGEYKQLQSLTQLLGEFYAEKASLAEIKQLSFDISRVLGTVKNRLEKKLVSQKTELSDCAKKDIYRNRGDIITANIYRIPSGASSVTAMDYTTGEEVTIPLDTRLTAARNAQRLYAKYAKLKRAEEHLTVLIASGEEELAYVRTVEDALSRARTRKELDEIRLELGEVGYMSAPVTKKGSKKAPAGQHLTFTTTDGMRVLVGRNNRQNDSLTGNAEKNDIWFHVKNFPGSHVILCTEGEEPTDRDYTQAAMLAAYHSSIRGASNAEVDYTRVRYVKKPSGSKPGYVTYDKYYTAIVDGVMPDLGKENK